MDDTILGGEATISEAGVFKGLLNTYTRGLGQVINWEKSSVYFINNPLERKTKIAHILGCGIRSLPTNYLGLPLGTKPLDSL